MKKGIVVQVDDLCYRYGKNTVLNNISFNINAGEFVAIIGENGAGKTTLVKHFNSLLKPDSGKVLVGGNDTSKSRVSQMADKVGFVFQNPDHQIFSETVEKELAFGLKNLKMPAAEIDMRVREALKAVGLEKCRQSYPFALSKGERQRVALASVLAMHSEIIVLDEPTTGQDYRESMQIMQILRQLNENGHTIIFITHNMSLVAEFAQRVIVLCQGKIIMDGPVKKVFARPEILACASLELPPINQLGMALSARGIENNFLTVNEAYEQITDLIGGGSVEFCI